MKIMTNDAAQQLATTIKKIVLKVFTQELVLVAWRMNAVNLCIPECEKVNDLLDALFVYTVCADFCSKFYTHART